METYKLYLKLRRFYFKRCSIKFYVFNSFFKHIIHLHSELGLTVKLTNIFFCQIDDKI